MPHLESILEVLQRPVLRIETATYAVVVGTGALEYVFLRREHVDCSAVLGEELQSFCFRYSEIGRFFALCERVGGLTL